jgi:hypothetical protein
MLGDTTVVILLTSLRLLVERNFLFAAHIGSLADPEGDSRWSAKLFLNLPNASPGVWVD